MRPKQGLEPCQNIYKLKEKDKATFLSLAEEWVRLAASTKEPEETEFAMDSGASMHMVSKRDLNSAELEPVRVSKSPTTVVTASGDVPTKEEATVHVRELDLFVTECFLKIHRQFFHSENSAKITGFTTTGPSVKNHLSPKRAREVIAIYQTWCHS